MYAVRYGNLRLIRYLHEHGLLTEHPQCTYSLVHAACFNNDIETLRLIIDELKRVLLSLTPGPQFEHRLPT